MRNTVRKKIDYSRENTLGILISMVKVTFVYDDHGHSRQAVDATVLVF